MVSLSETIISVMAQVESADPALGREELIALGVSEKAGANRKTLLKWLNEQVEELEPVPSLEGYSDEECAEVVDKFEVERGDTIKTPKPRGKPFYRPEKRGGVWCLYDVNNGELRRETFDNKGDAKVFAGRLEAGEELDEPYFHASRD